MVEPVTLRWPGPSKQASQERRKFAKWPVKLPTPSVVVRPIKTIGERQRLARMSITAPLQIPVPQQKG